MPPNMAKVCLKQFEVFFPLAYYAIVAIQVVPPSICPGLILNLRGFRSISPSPIKCAGRSSLTLFASIILVSEDYHLPIVNRRLPLNLGL